MPEFTGVDAELTMELEGASVGQLANNLTTDVEGFALDARQGKVLDEKKLDAAKVANNLTTVAEGHALDARQGKWLNENKVGFADVEDSLTSDDVNRVLSAPQGRILNERIDGLFKTATVTLSVAGWSSLRQTVSVSGITADSIVLVTTDPSNYVDYMNCSVRCVEQGSGTLTFAASKAPAVALKANVLIMG